MTEQELLEALALRLSDRYSTARCVRDCDESWQEVARECLRQMKWSLKEGAEFCGKSVADAIEGKLEPGRKLEMTLAPPDWVPE